MDYKWDEEIKDYVKPVRRNRFNASLVFRLAAVVLCILAAAKFTPTVLAWWNSPPDPGREVRVEGVLRVLMNDTEKYSLLVGGPAGARMHQYPAWGRPLRFFFDVPIGQPKWAVLTCGGKGWADDFCSLTQLHLNSPSELGGGPWDHGKVGKGVTQVVQ